MHNMNDEDERSTFANYHDPTEFQQDNEEFWSASNTELRHLTLKGVLECALDGTAILQWTNF